MQLVEQVCRITTHDMVGFLPPQNVWEVDEIPQKEAEKSFKLNDLKPIP